jgi:hypothetical protein
VIAPKAAATVATLVIDLKPAVTGATLVIDPKPAATAVTLATDSRDATATGATQIAALASAPASAGPIERDPRREVTNPAVSRMAARSRWVPETKCRSPWAPVLSRELLRRARQAANSWKAVEVIFEPRRVLPTHVQRADQTAATDQSVADAAGAVADVADAEAAAVVMAPLVEGWKETPRTEPLQAPVMRAIPTRARSRGIRSNRDARRRVPLRK